MHRCARGVRYVSNHANSSSKRTNTKWDPIVSLELNHPSLVLLEKVNSRVHFRQILGQIMRCNLIGQTFPMSRLVLFSAISHPENLDMAITLFNHFTPNPNLYIYNTMINALSLSANGKSFCLYNSMLRFGVYPDKHTLMYLLQAARLVSAVMQIHSQAIVTGLLSYVYLQNSLVKMYLEHGLLRLAYKIFERMPVPDVISFNSLIVGYAKKGYGLEALEFFHQMMGLGLEPDEYTVLGLLVSCGQLGAVKFGKAAHAWIERRKSITSSNLILYNALLDMYVKCQELELALRVFDRKLEKDVISWNTIIAGCSKAKKLELAESFFDQMPDKDIVSWNSMIAGYASLGNFAMVRLCFLNMLAQNVIPDNNAMVSLISASADIGALSEGRWAHGLIIRMQMKIDAFLGSALIDMYSKCGSIERAFIVFSQVIEKDVTIWTTMMTGFAFHGYGIKALELLSEMQEEVLPNEVTFVSVLTACSHSGLVDQGIKIFNSMEQHGIEPGVEHYGSLVDLLARSGRLTAAKDIIGRMPMQPSRSIWGTMLSACQAQGEVEMAEIASRELLKLEPEDEGGYLLLSNAYAATGKWGNADNIRETMGCRGVKKTAGCSTVVVDGVVHSFVASDKKHQRWVELRSILNNLKMEMNPDIDILTIHIGTGL